MKSPWKSLLVAFIVSFPVFVFAKTEYTALQPIMMPNNKPLVNSDILTYLSNIYTFAIAIAGGLAVIRIVYSGIKYMLTDIVTSKGEARKEIEATIYGLLMILGSYVFLYTLNPNLVKFNLNIKQTNEITGSGAGLIGGPLIAAWKASPNSLPLTAFVKPGSSAAEAILAAAEFAAANPLVNNQTDETNNGRKACAYAVNQIVGMATGSPVNNGLSVEGLKNSMSNDPRFEYVGNDLSLMQPGDIIITQDKGSHTGIAGSNGNILSNNSDASEASGGSLVVKSSTAAGWTGSFGGSQVYRAK